MLDAKQIAQLLSQAENLWSGYNLPQLQKHLQELEEQTLTADFWQQLPFVIMISYSLRTTQDIFSMDQSG